MRTLLKCGVVVAASGLLALFVAVLVYYCANRTPPDVRRLRAIRDEWERTLVGHASVEPAWRLLAKPPTQTPLEKAATIRRLTKRSLELAKDYPETTGGLAALYLVACRAPETEAGHSARETLHARIATADLGQLARAILYSGVQWMDPGPGIAPAILDRVQQNPSHPRAAELLTCVCTMSTREGSEPTAPFAEAADLIAARYATSPDIASFCESLGSIVGSPPWATSYESHLRTILKENNDREVRCAALFALASLVQSSGEDRQVEAGQLYKQFVAEFDGEHQYRYRGIEQTYRQRAKVELEEIRSRGIGKPAPEIVGVDLDGQSMKLSDYRGKVLLLSFWATWCFPCMQFIPHELELATRLDGQPFAIVGVNGDTDEQAIKNAVAAHDITWRSFRNEGADKQTVSDAWQILGWPTLYLIDGEGIVRKRWIGAPSMGELNRAIDQLVLGSASTVALDGTAESHAAGADNSALGPGTAKGRNNQPPTGFIDEVYRGADGSATKYVVFIPHSDYGNQELPVILFLHGAGLSGTDGRAQLGGALATAIRNQESTFPFIAVFPQAQVGGWQDGSPDGKRALAILDEVERNYHADTKRVYLTGLSMGGDGTWSLAAAHPDRWAAIVPVSSSGDTAIAARIKDIPCWCFHGDADQATPAALSREMVRAIKNAGGRPLYSEISGAGHDSSCWDRVYRNPDLYEWLLLQKRP